MSTANFPNPVAASLSTTSLNESAYYNLQEQYNHGSVHRGSANPNVASYCHPLTTTYNNSITIIKQVPVQQAPLQHILLQEIPMH